MILSATLSKPTEKAEQTFEKPLLKIKINYENTSKGGSYFLQQFTKTQVFHVHLKEDELQKFLDDNIGVTFKNAVAKTESEEITWLCSKKGKITQLKKPLKTLTPVPNFNIFTPDSLKAPLSQKKKNYLLPEGQSVPFLVLLGIMNSDGKVINSKYDKFRQINRFLEFIDDVINELKVKPEDSSPLRIIDFGCGKSYLTFAVHYYLTQVKKINCQIEGLDLKEEVINYCNQITQKLNLENLIFHTGDIANYSKTQNPDIIITLHACDTATDYALKYAVEKNARAILSVPCCQHEINSQLQNKHIENSDFAPLLEWGIIKEKFSSLVTDALRGQWLEAQGYKVQMLEFIDIEHTPKNILIRAVKKENGAGSKNKSAPSLLKTLGINPEIWK